MHDVTREKAAEVAPLGWWSIMRHGGTARNHWRLMGCWPDEAGARARFDKIDIRQGGLALTSPDKTIVAWSSAPRLRTRW